MATIPTSWPKIADIKSIDMEPEEKKYPLILKHTDGRKIGFWAEDRLFQAIMQSDSFRAKVVKKETKESYKYKDISDDIFYSENVCTVSKSIPRKQDASSFPNLKWKEGLPKFNEVKSLEKDDAMLQKMKYRVVIVPKDGASITRLCNAALSNKIAHCPGLVRKRIQQKEEIKINEEDIIKEIFQNIYFFSRPKTTANWCLIS